MASDNKQLKKWTYGKHLYGAVFVASILLVGLAVYRAASEPLVDNSIAQEMLVKLTVLIPVIAIWMIAARGAKRFKNYAVSISGSDDGKSMNYLADGLLLFVAYIIILNFVSTIILLAAGTHFHSIVTMLANHVPVIIAVSASIFLFKGSRMLAFLVNGWFWTPKRLVLFLVPFVFVMILLAINFVQGASDLTIPGGQPRFALPAGLLLITYFIPHAVVWLLGVLSAGNLAWYAKNVPGSIYKLLFTDVYKGIVLVYLAIFVTELLISLPAIQKTASIALMLVYSVLVLAIAGYSFIYKGSSRLQKIEEIV